jgi:hypothetical protein
VREAGRFSSRPTIFVLPRVGGLSLAAFGIHLLAGLRVDPQMFA